RTGRRQRTRANQRRFIGPVQQALQPLTSLAQVEADTPELPETGRDAQAARRIMLQAPPKRGPNIVVFAVEASEPGDLGVGGQARLGLPDERRAPQAVLPAQQVVLAGLLKALRCVLAYRLEQAVARLRGPTGDVALYLHQRLRNQLHQRLQDLGQRLG